jgi:hypothetical protein
VWCLHRKAPKFLSWQPGLPPFISLPAASISFPVVFVSSAGDVFSHILAELSVSPASSGTGRRHHPGNTPNHGQIQCSQGGGGSSAVSHVATAAVLPQRPEELRQPLDTATLLPCHPHKFLHQSLDTTSRVPSRNG